MIHHVWTILCEQILVNPKNNGLSYINSIHESVSKTPIEKGKLIDINPFLIAMKWFKSSGKRESLDIKVSLRDAESKEDVVLTETKVDFKAKAMAIDLSMEIGALPLKREGLYVILVEYKPQRNKKWKHGSESPLVVVVKKNENNKEE